MNIENNDSTPENLFHLVSDVMAEVSPAMIWMTDVNGNCTFVNPAWMTFTGLTLEKVFDQNEWKHLIHPDDQKLLTVYYSDLNSESKITLEYRLRHADGNWRWVLDVGVPVFNSEHTFCGYIGSAIDITEHKQISVTDQYYAAIVKSSEDAIISKDICSIVTGWNPAAERIFGYTAAEMIGSPMLKLFPSDRVDEEKFIMEKILRGESIKHFESARVRKDGEQIDISVSISPIHDETGNVIGASKIARDITEQKWQTRELHRSEATIRAILETAVTAIITIDEKGIIQSFNLAAERLFQYGSLEIIDTNVKTLMPEPYHSEHDNYLLHYMAKGQAHIIGCGREVVCKRKDGSIFPADLAVSEISLDDGRKFVGILTDISARKKAEKEIEHLAFHDPLTGLANRRKLLECLNCSIRLSHREHKRFAVFMMDLDKFKAVNDLSGHAAGDNLLKQVSVRIMDRLRESDMVARLGGDEFVVVIEDFPTIDDAEKVATDIIADLTVPFELDDGSIVQIGASIDISFYPKDGDTPEQLTDKADIALYKAKDKGRGCFAHYAE